MKIFSNTAETGWALKLLLPAGMMSGTWLFDDYFFPATRLTPLMSLVSLTILAFLLRPREMAFWAASFSAFVAIRIYSDIKWPLPPGDFTPYIRIIGFVVGSSITTVLCLYRIRLEGHAREIFNILSSLPIPVLVSDDSGTIVFTNDKAAILLRAKAEDLIGQSFFSLLISPTNQGRTIARYIEIIDSTAEGESRMPLKIRGRDDIKVTGSMALATFAGSKALITVLEVDQMSQVEQD